MPGIFGAININSNNDFSFFKDESIRIANILKYDNSKFFTINNISHDKHSLGRIGSKTNFKDFSIGDWVCFGFGLFKFIPDSEIDWIDNLNGSFSLVCINNGTGEIRIISDRISSQPIYYLIHHQTLFFAPEVKALSEIVKTNLQIDYCSLGSLISNGHLIAGRTLHKQIKSLEGGHYLSISNGNLNLKRYWQFAPGTHADANHKLDINEFRTILDDSVKTCFESNLPAAIFLSGGYDSRAIFGSFLNQREKLQSPALAVTWGTERHTPDSDAEIAREMAKSNAVKHIFLKRDTDNFADNFRLTSRIIDWQSDIPAFHSSEFKLMQQLQEYGIQIVLRGDEAFGWKRKAVSKQCLLALVGIKPASLISGFSMLFNYDVFTLIQKEQNEVFEHLLDIPKQYSFNQSKDIFYLNQRLQNYLRTASYYKTFYFEHHNPLLDYSILDYIERIPDSERLNKLFFKKTVHNSFPDLNKFPIAHHSGLESIDDLVYLPGNARDYILDEINDSKSLVWNFICKKQMEILVYDKNFNFKERWGSSKFINLKRLYGRFFSSSVKLQADSFREISKPIPNYKIIMRFLVFKNWLDNL